MLLYLLATSACCTSLATVLAPAVLVPVEKRVADAREPNPKEDKDEAQPINHSCPVLVTHAYTQRKIMRTISDIPTIKIIKKISLLFRNM